MFPPLLNFRKIQSNWRHCFIGLGSQTVLIFNKIEILRDTGSQQYLQAPLFFSLAFPVPTHILRYMSATDNNVIMSEWLPLILLPFVLSQSVLPRHIKITSINNPPVASYKSSLPSYVPRRNSLGANERAAELYNMQEMASEI